MKRRLSREEAGRLAAKEEVPTARLVKGEGLSRDERMVKREKELLGVKEKESEAPREVKPKFTKVGRTKVEVVELQPAQAAEIAAREEEIKARRVEEARKRILEKELAAA